MSTLKVTRLIKQAAGGTIFSILFRKRGDGRLRLMVCRLGVRASYDAAGAPYDSAEHGLLTVYDMHKHAWRSIPLDGVKWIKIRGEVFEGGSQ